MDAAAEGARRPTAGSIASMHAAARLYYGEELAQHEVAERLNVSRSTVSRLLRQARAQGIVRIEVRPPSPAGEQHRCEVAQAQRFPDLRGVRLVPAVGGMDEVDVRFQPNEIARRMADGSGAECSLVT